MNLKFKAVQRNGIAAILSLVWVLASFAKASTIMWSGPQNITGANTDVINPGTGFQYAYSFADVSSFDSSSTLSVNGVTFTQLYSRLYTSAATNWGIKSGSDMLNGIDFTKGTPATPIAPSGASGDYAKLLNSSAYDPYNAANGATPAVTSWSMELRNLTVGQKYQFQIFMGELRETSVNTRNGGTLWDGVSGSAASGLIDLNVGNAEGNLGQSIVGQFTADAATQDIVFQKTNGSSIVQFSAFSLHAIPEPSTYAMMIVAALICFVFCKRKSGNIS